MLSSKSLRNLRLSRHPCLQKSSEQYSLAMHTAVSSLVSSVAVTSQTMGQLFSPGPHLFIIAEDATAEFSRYLAIGLAELKGALRSGLDSSYIYARPDPKLPFHSPICKRYLLTWAGKWRMAGSNTWCIIQPLSVFIRSSVPLPH